MSRAGLSYSQVSGLLAGLYDLAVSDGEVANILQRRHETWLPAYNRLLDSIRAAPVKHYDETPWHIQSEDNNGYAWCMSDASSPDVCYVLSSSRGARQARALHGSSAGLRVTDGYAVYLALPGAHQLCWVHLFRKGRDLAGNTEVPAGQQPYVRDWYDRFAKLYADLRSALAEPYDSGRRDEQAAELWQRTAVLAHELPTPEGEPAKLTRLKAELIRAGKDRLFVCLSTDAPCDNNRAERDLRQLVCKRKRSFGSKTQKGANALATVLSICTTTWRRCAGKPAGYYKALAGV